MFFGYPEAATQNNWLHECMCQAVRNIHALMDQNRRYPVWPGILPTTHRNVLKRRDTLRDLLKAYYDAVRRLAKEERDRVLGALESQNRIPELLSGAATCDLREDLPQGVREPIAQLFTYAFGILGELGLRRPHYSVIYAQMPVKVCPFCGLHGFRSPEGPDEALDHYLNRVLYPFAASNLRNLVPMCHECNSTYKKSADMLRRSEDGTRRVAFDPYGCITEITVSVDGSKPFLGGLDAAHEWIVQLGPDTDPVKTWDDVFSVRERYRRDYLKPWYKPWVDIFATSARKLMGSYSKERLIEMLQSHEEDLTMQGLGGHAFLRAAVFRMLRRYCEDGHQDALDHLREWIYPPVDEMVDEAAEHPPAGANVQPVQSASESQPIISPAAPPPAPAGAPPAPANAPHTASN